MTEPPVSPDQRVDKKVALQTFFEAAGILLALGLVGLLYFLFV